jgi:hypothetical protein
MNDSACYRRIDQRLTSSTHRLARIPSSVGGVRAADAVVGLYQAARCRHRATAQVKTHTHTHTHNIATVVVSVGVG